MNPKLVSIEIFLIPVSCYVFQFKAIIGTISWFRDFCIMITRKKVINKTYNVSWSLGRKLLTKPIISTYWKEYPLLIW